MLDIRATHYVSPLAEVPFTDTTLTVHLVNVADETGLITGRFRVYNDSTGLLIHDSEIAPVTLVKGQTADVSALTDFDPPAPLDDVYFVLFDGNASNPLVPDGIGIHLGAFHFDVKVGPLGPAPAAHAVTHGAGGSDPLDHGTLTGLADDDHPQYQEEDEKGAAGGYCGLPNPLDTTLPLRADGTPAYPKGMRQYADALSDGTTATFPNWVVNTTGGTFSKLGAPGANHPGVLRIRSAAPADTGGRIFTSPADILIAGAETDITVIRPQTLANSTIRAGLLDSITIAAPTDGAFIEMSTVAGVPGTTTGKTYNNTVGSTTASSFVLTSNVWYVLVTRINATATRVDFEIWDDAGNLLWTDFLTTNIPTAAGRECGSDVIALSSGVVDIADLDYKEFRIDRDLHRP